MDAVSLPLPRKKNGDRATSLCFTLNNYSPAEVAAIRTDAIHYKWLCYGEEVGENGTPHLQGAFSVIGTSAVAYSTIHGYPGMLRAHFIKSMGTCQQNLDYCFKGDLSHTEYMTGGKRNHPHWGRNAVTFFHGTAPEPGKSHKLREAANLILSGAKVADLARMEEFAGTTVQYTRGLLFLESCNVPRRTCPPKVFWLYGATDTGKTRSAFEFGTVNGSVWKSGGNSTVGSGLRWFDGYNGQRVAIIDDFRAKGTRFEFLLQLLDRYDFRVEYKTGSIDWTPHFIFITTPLSISKTFKHRKEHLPEDIKQLKRRITHSLKFGKALGEHSYASALAFFRRDDGIVPDIIAISSSSDEELSEQEEYYRRVGSPELSF